MKKFGFAPKPRWKQGKNGDENKGEETWMEEKYNNLPWGLIMKLLNVAKNNNVLFSHVTHLSINFFLV